MKIKLNWISTCLLFVALNVKKVSVITLVPALILTNIRIWIVSFNVLLNTFIMHALVRSGLRSFSRKLKVEVCLKQHLTEEGYLAVSFYSDLVKASLRLKMIQMYLDPVADILAYFR